MCPFGILLLPTFIQLDPERRVDVAQSSGSEGLSAPEWLASRGEHCGRLIAKGRLPSGILVGDPCVDPMPGMGELPLNVVALI